MSEHANEPKDPKGEVYDRVDRSPCPKCKSAYPNGECDECCRRQAASETSGMNPADLEPLRPRLIFRNPRD